MKTILTALLLIVSLTSFSQDCSPYHKVKKWELDKHKSGGIGYVACLHARGVVGEVGYNNVFLGVLAMGKGHHGATYSFLQYEYAIHQLRIYAGPAYRLNNNPGLIVGRFGADIQLYKPLCVTVSILQINKELNYFHFGLKLVI